MIDIKSKTTIQLQNAIMSREKNHKLTLQNEPNRTITK